MIHVELQSTISALISLKDSVHVFLTDLVLYFCLWKKVSSPDLQIQINARVARLIAQKLLADITNMANP